MWRPYSEASRLRSSSSTSTPFAREDISRRSRQPIGLGHFAGAGVLGARRAVDQQDARRAVGVVMPRLGRVDRMAARRSSRRRDRNRGRRTRPGLAGERAFAAIVVGVPGRGRDLFQRTRRGSKAGSLNWLRNRRLNSASSRRGTRHALAGLQCRHAFVPRLRWTADATPTRPCEFRRGVP